MQDKHLFEYAVIRIVPRVEREEFINAGVILYCTRLKFLDILFVLDRNKIRTIYTDTDTDEVLCNLRSFENICKGNVSGGPIAKLDMPSRFRWLTATRSTIIQTSKVHPGFCSDPADTLSRLFIQLIG